MCVDFDENFVVAHPPDWFQSLKYVEEPPAYCLCVLCDKPVVDGYSFCENLGGKHLYCWCCLCTFSVLDSSGVLTYFFYSPRLKTRGCPTRASFAWSATNLRGTRTLAWFRRPSRP